MAIDLKRFYQACNPNKTLDQSKPEDRQYYIDFSEVRGAEIIKELKRTITLLSPDTPTCQLFTGHIGCGKSTELLRLKAELEEQEFHVVYFESSESLDLADIDITDILLAIAREVSESLESVNIRLRPGYFQNLFTEVSELLKTPLYIGIETELSVGIGKITAKTKDSPKLRSQLRQYLEPRTNGILESINKELLIPANEKLKRQGKKGLVVIIDNLDRIDNAIKPNGEYQPEYLFVTRGEQLNKLNCHIVYTIPLFLIFSNALGRLTNRFGSDPKVLPMVAIKKRNGEDYKTGINLLERMIMTRAFPDVNWKGITEEEGQVFINKVFENPQTLERLCKVSGGHLRNLLMLLFRCLQIEDVPISRKCVEQVIKNRCNQLSLAIIPDEWELIKEVRETKTYSGNEKYDILLRSMFVFEYRDDVGSWFDINPILIEGDNLTS
ncbi:MAG: ATP-binding protein [Sphaerospermopsis sp. SIO1G2]|nr:ATP-binding protein [Sphaerospermopsis sp. SIO1G1]NET70817.1 ATP-binding protein [Sphaerospermopsis sp. SIO1G2]